MSSIVAPYAYLGSSVTEIGNRQKHSLRSLSSIWQGLDVQKRDLQIRGYGVFEPSASYDIILSKTTSYANFRAYKMHHDYRIHRFNDNLGPDNIIPGEGLTLSSDILSTV